MKKIVLVKSPVVVGLVGMLPEGVNKLVFQFLGFPKKKEAEELKTFIGLAVNGGSTAINPKFYNRFRAGQEPEYYVGHFFGNLLG